MDDRRKTHVCHYLVGKTKHYPVSPDGNHILFDVSGVFHFSDFFRVMFPLVRQLSLAGIEPPSGNSLEWLVGIEVLWVLKRLNQSRKYKRENGYRRSLKGMCSINRGKG